MTSAAAPVEGSGWQRRGACRIANRDLFYPADDERPTERRRREQRAREVCRGCVVATQCLAYALETEDSHGIWGGMTEAERQRFRLLLAARKHVSR
ncbi:WhiB family transcriptional regulator [Mycobacteroides saopaulense]|uniref:WhiB family transcriptional regulator n=1 Tax=Mycobacteroides saopaulense TaxID=1578165 RepID=UPI001F2C711D|nr:WhiB family transcriptional regulator [Mycobacteroides saopaulense]